MNDKTESYGGGPLLSSSLSSSENSGHKLESCFDDILSRMRQACGVTGDKKLSEELGITYSAITAARKRGTIPPAWYVAVSEKYGVSMDWLRTGEGETTRGGAQFAKIRPGERWDDPLPGSEDGPLWKAGLYQRHKEEPEPQPSIYNDSPRKDVSIADLLAKTARVLESNTVYREALHSNIEAFHHGVVLDERVNKMEEQFGQALASLQEQLREIQAENKTIRHELEESRAASSIRDTG